MSSKFSWTAGLSYLLWKSVANETVHIPQKKFAQKNIDRQEVDANRLSSTLETLQFSNGSSFTIQFRFSVVPTNIAHRFYSPVLHSNFAHQLCTSIQVSCHASMHTLKVQFSHIVRTVRGHTEMDSVRIGENYSMDSDIVQNLLIRAFDAC